MKGAIGARGALDLDFREHVCMKYIEINMMHCRYYTFHHNPGKLWKNTSTEIFQDNVTEEDQNQLPYFINLAWMEENDVKLQLADCKVKGELHLNHIPKLPYWYRIAESIFIPTALILPSLVIITIYLDII